MTQFGNFVEPKQKKVDRDAANEQTAYLRGNQPQPRQLENNPRDYDQVKVENGSGYPLDPFSILKVEGADAATWPERTNELFFQEGMRNGIESKGSQPGDDFDQVAVLQKSAPDTMFAQGVISGPTPVFVYFPTRDSLNYPFAIPDRSGNKQRLVASPYGLNRILWHAAPSDDFQECAGEVLQAYVNLGEDQQWHFWKLKSDLSCCGSAPADACTECGTVYQPDCPITRTIWAPKGLDLCGCENACGQWKQGDVVPAWWYESLGKWVTIPNFTMNLEEKEQTIVTGVTLQGLEVMPSTEEKEVVTNVILHEEDIELTPSDTPVEIELENTQAHAQIEVDGPVNISGNVSVPATSTATGPIKFTGSVETNTPVTLSGNLATTTPVTVSGNLNSQATINFTPGQNIGFVKTFTGSTPTLSWTPVSAPIYASEATFDGHFKENSETMEAHVTGSVNGSGTVNATVQVPSMEVFNQNGTGRTPIVTDAWLSPQNLKVNFSGLSASLNLGAYTTTEEVVVGIRRVGCEIVAETKTIRVINDSVLESLNGRVPVTLSGSISIELKEDQQGNPLDAVGMTKKYLGAGTTSAQTAQISASDLASALELTGTVDVPAEVTGTVHYNQTGTFSASLITGWNRGAMNATAGTLQIPVGATVNLQGTATLSGNVTTNTPVTVSGNLATDSSVSLNGMAEASWNTTISGDISLTDDVHLTGEITQPLEASGTATVQIPNCIHFREGALDLRKDTIPITTLNPTSGTITGETTTTIKYLGCKECDE
ncbi:MAG: hypothetical protein IJK97_09080 [Thermoguttaceae bacterium]|nr:hypothetical protein [Thermoguttaceae bacterium]